MSEIIIGVDLSKDHLDVHRLDNEAYAQFKNSKSGFKAFTKWIANAQARLVYEPTGPYHRAFEDAMAAAGHRLVKVNPRHARRFAEATGNLAKTDACDAALLARMGAALNLPAHTPPDALMRDLKELLLARAALIKERTATKNRRQAWTLNLLKAQSTRRLAQITAQIIDVEAAIDALIQADANLTQRFEILCSIPGLSAVTARALLIEMPELGAMHPGQPGCLAGLAPVPRQSGLWRGKSFIRGGRANLRQALYMPALVAAKFNPDLRKIYERLTQKGKPPKVAITALMRKIIELANALLRDHRKWSPVTA